MKKNINQCINLVINFSQQSAVSLQESGADCIYTAKCVGQSVQVKTQGLEC